MVQIPIISGIYTDNGPDFRTSYPVNMVPVPKQNGISEGFLRPADGLVSNGTGPGINRGGINWNGTLYRVLGENLVSIASDGTVTVHGTITGTDLVSFDYSFTLLAIWADGKLYYFDGATVTQNTDPDLGVVIDGIWIDGYFMSTDGESLIVTDLNDPYAVNPLKYGSSEADPDPVTSLFKLRNEAVAVNRYTMEYFDNIGGSLFPFQRIEGAQVQKGALGTQCVCLFVETVAILGSGRNEAPGIYMCANASANKISTQEIDMILLQYTEAQLSAVKLEARNDRAHQHLYVHLPDRTLVFDAQATQEMGQPVWFTLTTSLDGFERYRARDLVWAYDRWNIGDPASSTVGYFTENSSHAYGEKVRWEFATSILYNEGRGAQIHQLELVALPGRVAIGLDPTITTSYSIDGETWSQLKAISIGTTGNRTKRLTWWQQGYLNNWRIQRFQGDSDAQIAFARLEAQIEPMAW